MLPTFVIGLREGVEAALIVGIIAAFLRQEQRGDALRYVWAGVGIAIVLCAAVGVALQIVDQDLPQRQQEGLETIVGLAAVGMVTFMIVWMRRNARGLRKELEASAAGALARGSIYALVGMAFFAVLREGLETAVFLLAAFQSATNPTTAGIGALLGIALAVVIGYGIYRGGVRINLQKFFRFTAAILVLVAAGLLASAAHTAHEAGWLNSLQGQAIDLSWLIDPGTVTSSLLTGMLGLQPQPTVAEVAGLPALRGSHARLRALAAADPRAARRPGRRQQRREAPRAGDGGRRGRAPACCVRRQRRRQGRQEGVDRADEQRLRAGQAVDARPARPRSRSRTRAATRRPSSRSRRARRSWARRRTSPTGCRVRSRSTSSPAAT